MLKKLVNRMGEAAGQLADWFQDLVADYAGELLAAHGLIEVEVDQIRQRREAEELEGKNGDGRSNVVCPGDFGRKGDARLGNQDADRISAPEAGWMAKGGDQMWHGIETLVAVVLTSCLVLAFAFFLTAFVSR